MPAGCNGAAPPLVRCYRNLHRKVWSVKRGNDPVVHRASLVLKDVVFRVWASGRLRVLREKRKNVHAFACGQMLEDEFLERGDEVPLSYNPQRAPLFYRKDTGEFVTGADYLALRQDGTIIGRGVK
jgi:hypothetical protein